MVEEGDHVRSAPPALFDNEEIYRLIIENSRDLIRVIDTDFNFVYVSPSHETLLGYTVDEMMHTASLNILHPDDKEVALSMHRQMVSKITSMDGLFRFQCKNGQWITLETRGKSLVKEGKIVGVVTIGRDVTRRLHMEQEVQQYQEQLRFLAFHDPLTKLPNRLLFFEETDLAIQDAVHSGQDLALLFIDCDNFKSINDAYGHGLGDDVVKELGRRLSNSVLNHDSVARMGGDEFTVLLRYIDSPKEVVEAVHRILRGTQALWEINGHSLELTVSIGIAMYPSDGRDTRTLIRNADEALYHAKNRGKNTYVFYDSSVRP